MGSGFYVCARQRTRWPRGSMVCCSKFFRKSHAFELVATDLAGFEPNSRKGVIPVIPISCRMRSSGKKIGKEGHTREIRQPLVLIRFALNLNKENSIVATRERGFESLRPDQLKLKYFYHLKTISSHGYRVGYRFATLLSYGSEPHQANRYARRQTLLPRDPGCKWTRQAKLGFG